MQISGTGYEALGRVDGFDQDEAEGERDERAVILRRLFAPTKPSHIGCAA